MKILYKSKNTVVVYKPEGISSQPDATLGDDALTLTSKQLKEEGEADNLYPVHRLDKVVGGLLVFARNKSTAQAISAIISGEGIAKEYLAVTDGIPECGVLTDYLFKDTRQNKAIVTAKEKEGAKLARLTASPLEVTDTPKGKKALLRVKLDTGRFHQIRAQLSSRGTPITGDSKYGSRDYKTRTPALASVRISFTLGSETVDVTCPPDTEKYPWNLFSAENYISKDMTEKLYYKDAYIREFTATVISSTECDGGYDTVLDRTAFFPEEGGQSCDRGIIGAASVSYVYERDGVVHHITDEPLTLGKVSCALDFESRFDKMQCHTAEHILCGIIHRRHGLENVGFHIGDDEVTFDVSSPLSREELLAVEDIANEVVFRNLEVETFFPTPEELPTLNYRAKLELTEGVRLVKVGDVDLCACCAPHVSRTGEIGLIKILEVMNHRGGMRIWMVAGKRALTDYRIKYDNIRRISAILSIPQHETAKALAEYVSATEELKAQLKATRRALAESKADTVTLTDGNAVFLFPDFGAEELRAFVNAALPKVSGILVALSGRDGDYKYLIASNSVNLTAEIKNINQALLGRGGGKPNAVQGSFASTLSDIRAYFNA